MANILMESRINPKVMQLISKIYQGDTTIIKIGDEEVCVEVTSGTKPGCPGSTILFKLITHRIIQKLEKLD